MTRDAWRSVAVLGVAGLFSALAVQLAGCNVVAPAYYLIHGPEKIQRLYELDPTRPTVIFLDDRALTIRRTPTRERIAATAEQVMLDQEVVERVIDSRAATAIVTNEPSGELMPISEVGRKIGAEVVIYVTPEQYTLSMDGSTFAPSAQLRVKIMDATADERIWPPEREGYLLNVSASTRQGTTPQDAAEVREAEDKFAELVGERLAQMFYSREAETVRDERER